MAIATAVQRGSMVQVYDERGRAIFSRSGDLHGYTGGLHRKRHLMCGAGEQLGSEQDEEAERSECRKFAQHAAMIEAPS